MRTCLLCLLLALAGCQPALREVEWYENGQLKRMAWGPQPSTGGNSVKFMCYGTDCNNQTQTEVREAVKHEAP